MQSEIWIRYDNTSKKHVSCDNIVEILIFGLSSCNKMMRHKELWGFLLNLYFELAVLSPFLPALFTFKRPWLLSYLHSIGANLNFWKQHYVEQGLVFPEMLNWHSGRQRHNGYGTIEVIILASEWAFQQSVPTLLNTGSWQCCLSFQTQVAQLHAQHWYIQLPPTPLIPDIETFFFWTCTSANQENCAKATDVSPAKAKLQVSGKPSPFEIHSTYSTIFLVQPEEHDFWKGLNLASLPRGAILHLQSAKATINCSHKSCQLHVQMSDLRSSWVVR